MPTKPPHLVRTAHDWPSYIVQGKRTLAWVWGRRGAAWAERILKPAAAPRLRLTPAQRLARQRAAFPFSPPTDGAQRRRERRGKAATEIATKSSACSAPLRDSPHTTQP